MTQRSTGAVVSAAASSSDAEVTVNVAVSPGSRVSNASSTVACGSRRSGNRVRSRRIVPAVTVTR